MAFLNLDLDYFDHPKTIRLVGLLGRGAEVLPLKLWVYCGRFHKKDGKLTGYSTQEIESVVAWWGKESAMVNAMLKVGFLKELPRESGFQIHDWEKTQGHLHAFHVRAAEAAEVRWGKLRCPKDATSIAQASPKQSPSRTVPTVPTKEEKPPTPLERGNDVGNPQKKTREKGKPVPYWAELIDHIKRKWEFKKRPHGKFDPDIKDFMLLQKKASVYSVFDLMALYDDFIVDDNKFYWENGHKIWVFCRAIDALLDGPRWKERSRKYESENCPPAPAIEEMVSAAEVSALLANMTNGKVQTSVGKLP